jgi:hypothetical protein
MTRCPAKRSARAMLNSVHSAGRSPTKACNSTRLSSVTALATKRPPGCNRAQTASSISRRAAAAAADEHRVRVGQRRQRLRGAAGDDMQVGDDPEPLAVDPQMLQPFRVTFDRVNLAVGIPARPFHRTPPQPAPTSQPISPARGASSERMVNRTSRLLNSPLPGSAPVLNRSSGMPGNSGNTPPGPRFPE